MKKRDLTKKVLCTVLAASVFGVFSNGIVEAAKAFEDGTYHLEEGQYYTDDGENVYFENATVTVDGTYKVQNVEIEGNNKITVNGAGVVNEGIDMGMRNPAGSINAELVAKNAKIYGIIDIAAGKATLENSEIISGGTLETEEPGKYVQENIRVHTEGSGQGKLILKNVNVTGDVMAEYDGAEVEITGGTFTEVEYYEYDNDHNYLLGTPGNFVTDGYTEVHAEKGGKVTINDAVLNTGVSAFGNDSVVIVNNSSISTKGSIFAAAGAKIYLNGDANTVYSLGGEDVFMALTGIEDGESGDGLIEINGGTLKAENLRYLVGKDDSNHWLAELKKDGYEITKGGIVLQGSGVIETKGDQIFERGVDVSSDEAVLASTSGAVTNDAISYVGGTLKLTDEKYSLNYLDSAKDALIDYQSDSETKIVMTGTLVTGSGNNENEIDVDDVASIGDDVELDQVTVNADKNLLVGSDSDNASGKFDDVVVEDKVANGFSAGKLNLAANSTGMVITNAKNVTLGGSAGGNLITVGGKIADVKVVVGTDSVVEGANKQTGSFTIGNRLATSNTEYTLKGSVTVNKDSVLNVNGKTTVTNGVTLNGGSVNVGNGTLETTDVTANGNSTITGTATVDNLTGASNAVINVGNDKAAGKVTVNNAALNGATVFLDPMWVDGTEITDASQMAVAGTDGKVAADGKYVVGRNSVMSFGVGNNEKAQETFSKTGLTWGEDATAGLYINGSVNVADGAVVVDGKQTAATDAYVAPANGTFTAAANSVVMVDGQDITDNDAAITGVTEANVTINKDSKLYIDGAQKCKTYHVIDGVNNTGWQDANIISNNALLVFEGKNTNSKFDVTASYDKVNNVYGEGAVVIDSVVDKTLADKNAGDKAFDFFNAAANANNNATKAAQIAAFNSAANMGDLAGVNHGTYSMSNAMTDAVAHHLSLATHGEQDKDIWAHYIHNKEDIDGMDFGGVDGSYEAQYNGIVVGSDLYKNGKTTAGIALSYADGNINGSNIASSTKNDAEYYGASLYGRIDNGDSAILGDISYMHSDNDITQNNSGHEITASADADAFSIGIRAEQAYKAGAGKFVPYAGIRYMHLGAGDYSNSFGMEYNADDQNLWLLPVGVTYSAEVQSGDWTVKPIAEVGYVWTMGDRDTDQTVSLNGASDTFGFETADSGSFIGRLGIEAEKADVTYGLSYEYQKGDTVKANKWMANLTWSF